VKWQAHPSEARQGRLAAARKRAPAEPWPQGHWRERKNRRHGKASAHPFGSTFCKEKQEQRAARHHTVCYSMYRCSAKQPARKPLPPFRAQCSCWSNSFTRLRFDSAHASSRPSGPFAAPLGRPDRPARSRACLTSGSERRASSEPPRLLPDTKRTRCAVRPDSSGGRCRVARGKRVEGSDTLHLRPAAVTDRTCRSLRPTTHRFAWPDVPRAAGRNLYIGILRVSRPHRVLHLSRVVS
jgi:hypothetical protein